jgi:hypothetical protein
MRRIAVAAALAATLGGGAAALAATPGPATTDATPPDPYQGAWQLVLDGKPAGLVMNVEGCDLKGQVVASLPDQHKHVAAVAPEPCTFDIGAGMTPAFAGWLNEALQGHATRHDAELVRSDVRPGYALDLPQATVAAVTLPKVDGDATTPASLHVALTSDQVRRVAATAPPIGRTLSPRSVLTVSVGGQPVAGATSVGPWTATIKPADDAVGRDRDVTLLHTVDIGDLPIRVRAGAPASVRSADVAGWAQGVLVEGKTGPDQERPVTVTVGGLTLTLGNAAPDRADLVPRADGALTYDLYAESAGLTAAK